MYFLPYWSCPYRQHITRDIPSMPRFLHQHGYRTAAILADPPFLFNRRAVLGHVGFDGWLFPKEDPQTRLSPDGVIATSRGSSPYFVFAFTGATHFPWNYSDYLNSTLDVAEPMPEPLRLRLKTYINAVSVADRSLKKLVEHFESSDPQTAILTRAITCRRWRRSTTPPDFLRHPAWIRSGSASRYLRF